MKKLFVTFFAALFALAFISAQAAVMKKSSVSAGDNSALIGNWVNVNSKTSGLVKLIIKQNTNGTVSISGFGKCHPTDCAWGKVALQTFSNSLTDKNMMYGLAVWKIDNSAIDTTMTIKKMKTNEMRATIYESFNDNSGRFNYSHSFTLKLVK